MKLKLLDIAAYCLDHYVQAGLAWLALAGLYNVLADGTIVSFIGILIGIPVLLGALALGEKIIGDDESDSTFAQVIIVLYCCLPILMNGIRHGLEHVGLTSAAQLAYEWRFWSLFAVIAVMLAVTSVAVLHDYGARAYAKRLGRNPSEPAAL